jgi:hypothetical protein
MQPPATLGAHQRFQAVMLAVAAGSDDDRRRSHNSPKVGEQNALVDSRPVEPAQPGRGLPVGGGQRVVAAEGSMCSARSDRPS